MDPEYQGTVKKKKKKFSNYFHRLIDITIHIKQYKTWSANQINTL